MTPRGPLRWRVTTAPHTRLLIQSIDEAKLSPTASHSQGLEGKGKTLESEKLVLSDDLPTGNVSIFPFGEFDTLA